MARLKWKKIPGGVGWNKIYSLRKAKGLSQAELAVGVGVSITTIYYLELGYEERTTDEVKKRIAEFFDVDVDDIFPAEMLGNEPRERCLGKIKKGTGQPILK